MCGIVGVVYGNKQTYPKDIGSVVEKMNMALVHRGPDGEGKWVDRENGIGLGHRRLAILDLSKAGHQPMASSGGRYIISFNGELYNFRDIKAEIESARGGVSWKGTSDTEILLEAINEWGIEQALHRCNGMFALALWDKQEKCLFLARDRIGEKPLYYGWVNEVFIFASELKALREYPEWNGAVDRNVLATYFRYNHIPSYYSIYKGVFKLEPASYLRLNLAGNRNPGDEVVRQYWSYKDVLERNIITRSTLSKEEALENLAGELKTAIFNRMASDVPLGALLSGGYDSATIVAIMQSMSSQPIKTFSVGFWDQALNEAEYAREISEYLGTSHTEAYATEKEALEIVPELPIIYDEPFADPSQIPMVLIMRMIKDDVTVVLSGDGGDELFGGYNRYITAQRMQRLITGMSYPISQYIGRVLERFPELITETFYSTNGKTRSHKLSHIQSIIDKAGKAGSVFQARNKEDIYKRLMSVWNNPNELVLGASEVETCVDKKTCWPFVNEFLDELTYFDIVGYLPDDIMVKGDRASMASSIELRMPLVDYHLMDVVSQLPANLKVRSGKGKWLLRELAHKYIPKKMLDRPKRGFGIPVDAWLRGGLREWAEELLDENRLKNDGYLNTREVRSRWNEHIAGKRNWGRSLWGVLMFCAWHNQTN